MGERKGTNKYYPPDFDPKKHRSLAGYHGQHPLRERARKLGQGILVIRFEMPYNIWCGGCNSHIGMGVRYNAEKSKIGNYYTTPIYKFRMKCHLCNNYMEIKTDPANHDYVIISGARRKEQRWDPKENEQIVPEDRASQKKLALDAMYRLEHGADDKAKLKAAKPGVAQIVKLQQQRKDDYLLNKLARNKFRAEKQSLQHAADRDSALLHKSSLDLSLVPEHQDDIHMAELLQYQSTQSYDEKQQQKREAIKSRPLFGVSSSSLSSPTFSSGSPSTHGAELLNTVNTKHRLGLAQSAASFASPGSVVRKDETSLGIIRKSQKEDINRSISNDASSSINLNNGDPSPTPDSGLTQKCPPLGSLQNQDMSCNLVAEEFQGTELVPSSGITSDSAPDAQLNSGDSSTLHGNNALLSLVSHYDTSDSDST